MEYGEIVQRGGEHALHAWGPRVDFCLVSLTPALRQALRSLHTARRAVFKMSYESGQTGREAARVCFWLNNIEVVGSKDRTDRKAQTLILNFIFEAGVGVGDPQLCSGGPVQCTDLRRQSCAGNPQPHPSLQSHHPTLHQSCSLPLRRSDEGTECG